MPWVEWLPATSQSDVSTHKCKMVTSDNCRKKKLLPATTANTVEPLYKGRVGAGRFVHYKEVSFIERFVQEHICNSQKVYYDDKMIKFNIYKKGAHFTRSLLARESSSRTSSYDIVCSYDSYLATYINPAETAGYT